MKRYFRFALSFRGLLTRSEFLLFIIFMPMLAVIPISFLIGVFAAIGVRMGIAGEFFQFFHQITVIGLVSTLMLSAVIRRLRDIGVSRWWTLVILIPYLNFFFILSLLFKPGWNRSNGLRNMLAMIKFIAESDGRVNLDEARFFYHLCSENIPDEKIISISHDNFIRGASNPFLGFDYHLKKYLKNANPVMGEKLYVMDLMVAVAESDGEINSSENVLLERVYKAFCLGEDLPEGFEDLIAMLAKLSKADGVVDESEIGVIHNWFTHAMGFSKSQIEKAVRIFDSSKNSPVSFEQHVRNFARLHQGNRQLLENVMGLLTELAFADRNISKEEEDMIESAAAIFGFKKRDWDNCGESADPSADSYADDAMVYARILGVKVNTSLEEIKSRYRKLIAANHPDKVATMSEAIKNAAEIETKKINQAYEYFKAQYA